ncbi:hypothetical protein ATPR_0251 [Acetobacter tropicalis NBRC 101654]|uniref:Uncharacterized protein n=1 Tax=Acetobacter tropicalis NBRC 101654 TaxID=749388 RepID=F7VA52_9PROT|nr:hypothetical protein ATPR_0251 [Acetobacter tropicalis NBRC 101654]
MEQCHLWLYTLNVGPVFVEAVLDRYRSAIAGMTNCYA